MRTLTVNKYAEGKGCFLMRNVFSSKLSFYYWENIKEGIKSYWRQHLLWVMITLKCILNIH